MIQNNIPNNARIVRYCYGKHKGFYHVWETILGKFRWSALGNSGEESTFNKAIESARFWIQDNFNKGE